MDKDQVSFPNNFRKLIPKDRLLILKELLEKNNVDKSLIEETLKLINFDESATCNADNLIESAIGNFQIPLGIVTNVKIDNTITHIPLATEEASVIAAANYASKIFMSASNGIKTSIGPALQIAQIALLKVSNQAENDFINALPELYTDLMLFLESMQRRGGGIRRIEYKRIHDDLFIVHLIIDVQNAMGANIANSAAEYIAPKIKKICRTELLASIVSNYSDERLVHALVELDINRLPFKNNNLNSVEIIAEKIEQMSFWAEKDIYRATTHNKGIMNGVSALALATGNDTRALEAASHALASSLNPAKIETSIRDSVLNLDNTKSIYNPLSIWRFNKKNKILFGTITLPALLATVGGSTNQGIARFNQEILSLNEKKLIQAHRLNRVGAALGLIQNFAALLAIVSNGIQEGHMKLHNKKLSNVSNQNGVK